MREEIHRFEAHVPFRLVSTDRIHSFMVHLHRIEPMVQAAYTGGEQPDGIRVWAYGRDLTEVEFRLTLSLALVRSGLRDVMKEVAVVHQLVEKHRSPSIARRF